MISLKRCSEIVISNSLTVGLNPLATSLEWSLVTQEIGVRFLSDSISHRSVLRSEFNTNCENLWVQLNLAGAKSVLIRAYYKPHKADLESIASFEALKKSLTLVNQTNSAVWLLGDLNLPEIDWNNLIPSPECGHPTFYRDCLEVLDDCLLEQMVTSPTRGQNILDLFLTTNPTLVDNVSITPGLSDHDIVLIQVNVKPEVLKRVPRNIH